MTMGAAVDAVCADDTPLERQRLDLSAEIRVGEAAHSALVTTLHATGVELHLKDEAGACVAFADEVVVAIPKLGHYKARRLRRNGARAAYTFEVTEFSRRALGALIAERFPAI
jgi:hypothetical protein